MTFLSLMLMLLSSTIAAQEIYPKGCIPWVIREAVPKLTNKQPTVMMMHNLTDSDLWLTHPTKDPGAQAGFSSKLAAGKWSALALSNAKKSFALMCIESRPGHEQQIACADVLAICQWPTSQLPESAHGIFWAGENMDLNPLRAYIERMGFILDQRNQLQHN